MKKIVSPGSGPGFSDASRSQSRVPNISIFSPGPRSRKFWIWVPVPVPDFKMSPGPSPGPWFPGPGLRDPGDPVPDADPCFRLRWGQKTKQKFFVNSELIFEIGWSMSYYEKLKAVRAFFDGLKLFYGAYGWFYSIMNFFSEKNFSD